MPDLNLPVPGVTPGDLWAEMNNEALNALNEVMEVGRLSEQGLEDQLVEIAAELNPTALSDSFIAQQLNSGTSATRTTTDGIISSAIASKADVSSVFTKSASDARYIRTAAELDALAVVSADFVKGVYKRENYKQAPGIVLGAVTRQAITSAPAQIRPATTNLLPVPFVGGVVGRSEFASTSPGPGKAPTGWSAHDNSSIKTFTEYASDLWALQIEANNGTWGGIRTEVGISLGAATEAILTGRISISAPAGRTVACTAAWRVDNTIQPGETEIATSVEGWADFSVRLATPTSGTTKQLILRFAATDGLAVSNGTIINVRFSKPVLTTTSSSVLGDFFANPPYFTGAVTEDTISLIAPDGNYVVIADTDRGVMAVNGTVTSNRLNLLTTVGPSAISRVWLINPSDYNPSMLDAVSPLELETVPYKASPSLVGRSLNRATWRKPGDIHPSASSVAYNRVVATSPKAVQVARNRRSYTLFDISPGDTATADGTANTERTEIVDVQPMPAGTVFWTALTCVFHNAPTRNASPHIVYQERYTNVVGDNSTLSPDFGLVFDPSTDPVLGGKIRAVARTGGGTPEETTQLFQFPWNPAIPNVAYHFVFRFKFGRNTPGELQAWINGTNVYDGTPMMGYDKDEGTQPHYGIYRGKLADNNRVRMSVHNYIRTTNSLLSLVSTPPPLQRSLVID